MLNQNLADPKDPKSPSLNTNNTVGVTCVRTPTCGADAVTKFQTTTLLGPG